MRARVSASSFPYDGLLDGSPLHTGYILADSSQERGVDHCHGGGCLGVSIRCTRGRSRWCSALSRLKLRWVWWGFATRKIGHGCEAFYVGGPRLLMHVSAARWCFGKEAGVDVN